MTAKTHNATEAELAVLQVLWSMGLATIREILDELYSGGGTSEYATIQKLLERLEGKDMVKRSRRQIPHTFAAAIDRDELLGHRLDDLAQSLCDGSMAPIVSHLVQRTDLSAAERAQLKQLVEAASGRSKKGGAKR